MAFPYSDIASIGDMLPVDRFALYFPRLPTGGEGKDLTLRNAGVSLPPAEVGQVVVNTFGWSVAFAGRRAMTNSFTATFVETTGSPVLHMLYAWQDMCAGFKNGVTVGKADYAVEAKLVAKDTTGEYAIECKLHNVWPKTITPHEFGETSAALEIEVEFSIDAVDLLNIGDSRVVLSELQSGFTTEYTGSVTTVGGFSASGVSGGISPSMGIGASSLTGLSSGSFNGFNVAQTLINKITGGGLNLPNLSTTGGISDLAAQFGNISSGLPTAGLSTVLQNTLGAGNTSNGGFGSTFQGPLSSSGGVSSLLSTFFG